MNYLNWTKTAFVTAAMVMAAGAATADTISPTSFSADLAVGESVTITKTVTVSKGGPTDARLDVMFVFDTTGSMGSTINGAKTAASDILAGLSAYGDLASGVGYYADGGYSPGSKGSYGIVSPLSTNDANTTAGISSLYACYGDCGGDSPELGNAGIDTAATDTSWRPGSNRFIVAFGDASFKDSEDYYGYTPLTDATVKGDLEDLNIKLYGLDVGYGAFSSSLAELGGTAFPSGTSASAITAAILAAVSAGFADYNTVTVGDLGAGSPEIEVTTLCKTADIGTCVGDSAVGTYDRSEDRTFTFDVTFKRIAAGDSSFKTHALVDGGIVASESDHFPGEGGGPAPVPLPAAGLLLMGAVGGLGALRSLRRKA